MADLLPAEHAGIVPWDAEASAANAARLIADPQPLVDAVRKAGAELTWDRTAEQLLQVYREAAVGPRRVSAEPRESLTDLAMALVGPGGWLTPDDQQALLAVSARPALRRTVMGALRSGYRAMYRVRRVSPSERQQRHGGGGCEPPRRSPSCPAIAYRWLGRTVGIPGPNPTPTQPQLTSPASRARRREQPHSPEPATASGRRPAEP
jgi:hypothetical protein